MAEEPSVGSGTGPRSLGPVVPGRDSSAADRVRGAEFPMVLRGYEREAVDAFVAETADLIDTLEARQTRESVVQRALEEVGEQTSAILKQAHESGDDITARSRSQAEDRVERARAEGAAIVAAAEARAAQLEQETAALRDERAGLLDDLRRLAAETLAVAGEAEDEVDSRAREPMSPVDAVESHYDGAEEGAADHLDEGAADPLDDWAAEDTEDQEETAEFGVASDGRPPGESSRPSG